MMKNTDLYYPERVKNVIEPTCLVTFICFRFQISANNREIKQLQTHSCKLSIIPGPLFPHGMGCIAQKLRKGTRNHPADSE